MVRTALTSVNTYQRTASLREPRPLGELGVGSVKSVINECLCGTSHYETPEGKGYVKGLKDFQVVSRKNSYDSPKDWQIKRVKN